MATTWKNSLRTTLGSKVRVFEKAVRTDESGKKVTVFMLRRSQEQDAAAAGGAAAAGHLQATAAARADGVAAPAAPLPLHHESLGELLSALRLARDSPSRPSLLRGAAVPSFELAMDSRVRAFPACVPRADCASAAGGGLHDLDVASAAGGGSSAAGRGGARGDSDAVVVIDDSGGPGGGGAADGGGGVWSHASFGL